MSDENIFSLSKSKSKTDEALKLHCLRFKIYFFCENSSRIVQTLTGLWIGHKEVKWLRQKRAEPRVVRRKSQSPLQTLFLQEPPPLLLHYYTATAPPPILLPSEFLWLLIIPNPSVTTLIHSHIIASGCFYWPISGRIHPRSRHDQTICANSRKKMRTVWWGGGKCRADHDFDQFPTSTNWPRTLSDQVIRWPFVMWWRQTLTLRLQKILQKKPRIFRFFVACWSC